MKKIIRMIVPMCAVAALLLTAGCEEFSKDRKTIKQEQYERWNTARVTIMLQLARQQFDANDYEKCRQTVTQCITMNPEFAPSFILAGRLELETGDVEKAADDFKQAIKIDPKNAEAYYFMGICYQRWQNFASALENYQKAWANKDNDPSYLLAAVEMKISLGQLDDAEKMLLEKLNYFEQTSALRVALARIETLRGHHDKASRYYRDAMLMAPEDLNIRRNYAESLYMAGRYSDALAVLDDLNSNDAIKEKNGIRLLMGQCYMNLKRTRDARVCFSDLVQQNPQDATAWLNLARVYMQTKEYGNATSCLQRLLAVDSKNAPALLMLAACQQKLNQWESSRDTLTRAMKITPDNSTIYCMLGITHDRMGDRAAAITQYQKAMQVNPHDTWAAELLHAAEEHPS